MTCMYPPPGTLRYMAPEVMRCEEYGELVDVYSFAMCAWFVVHGEKVCSVAIVLLMCC